MAIELTDAVVAKLPIPREGYTLTWDAEVPGFGVRVTSAGSRSYILKYTRPGSAKRPLFTIGTAGKRDWSTKAARAKCRELKHRIQYDGADPAQEKQERKDAQATDERNAVETVLEQFILRHAIQRKKNRTWVRTAAYLGLKPDPSNSRRLVPTGKGVCREWAGRQIDSIAKRDIIELLNKEVDRGAPVSANRLLAALRTLFNWCKEEAILTVSPCDGVKPRTRESSRERVLTDHELRLVLQAAQSEGWFGKMTTLLALTGQRRDEVANMRWSEVDQGGKTWTIPASRRKGNVPSVVPLSDAALAILKGIQRVKGCDLILSTDGKSRVSGFGRAKRRLDKVIAKVSRKPMPPWRLHDLRRTLATGLQKLGVRLEVTESVLGHVSGSRSGIVGIYQRHDWQPEKRAALDAWARHLEGALTPAGNVLPFAKAAGE